MNNLNVTMRRLILFAVMFSMMCGASSQARTIIISHNTWTSSNQPTYDFFAANFPDATIIYGDYTNELNAEKQAQLAALTTEDMFVICRAGTSSWFSPADQALYDTYEVPIICLSSYMCRDNAGTRLNWHSGTAEGLGIDGSEATITAAGAAIFGTGPQDWWSGTGNIWAAGTAGASVGDGTVLATDADGSLIVVGWKAGDTLNNGVAQAGNRLLFNIGGDLNILPNTAAGQAALLNAINSYTVPPDIQYNNPGNGMDLIPVARTASENDLVFTVNDPNIVIADVYLEATDPNADVMIVDDLAIGADGHGAVQKTVNLESLASDLSFDTTYYWKVIGYEPNYLIPANGNDVAVTGLVWSFTTAPEEPVITLDPPVYTAVDAGEPSIVLTANGINGDFQWYKDGSPIADAGGVYAGTMTNTLTIYDVQQADEGYYTCKVSNLIGEDESTPARVMIHRQTSYYNFEGTSSVDGNDVFVDSIGGYHAVLKQDAASAGLPTYNDANQLDVSLGNHLVLDNADHVADPNGQYLQIYTGVADYEDVTVTAWVYPKGGSVWQRVFDFGDGTTDYLFLTPDTGGGNLRFAMRINNGGEQQLSSSWLPSNAWYHVAVTISGNTGRMYRNGELVATNTGMTINPISIGAVLNYIGKSQYGSDAEFNGYIDELKIYNYALDVNTIAGEYYDATGIRPCVDPAFDGSLLNFDNTGSSYCRVDLADFADMAAVWLSSGLYPIVP